MIKIFSRAMIFKIRTPSDWSVCVIGNKW